MLREHEQSLSMKSLKFNVRCISIDCIPSVNSWYKVKEGISTGTGREQTVKDVVDVRRRAFNIRKEDYEDVFTAVKRVWTDEPTLVASDF